MSDQHGLAVLLPFYVNGTLDPEQRCAVEAHLASCPTCREELALWKAVGGVVQCEQHALPAPAPRVLHGALARLSERQPSALQRAWQLLRAQIPLVRREIWPASALVMGLGYLMALLAGSKGGSIIAVLAPLIAAAGIAMLYGSECDPALELALATPTAPRQVLLARLALVLGYDLLLSLIASLGLWGIVPVPLLGTLILAWLGPMTLLSTLALVLSMVLGSGPAQAVAVCLWLTYLPARGMTLGPILSGPVGQRLLQLCAQGWSNTALLLGLSIVLLAVAVWVAGRQELLLVRRAAR